MKYLIAVLLSVVFATLTAPKAPALTKRVVQNVRSASPTAKSVMTEKAVQPQPETKPVVKAASASPPVVAQQPVPVAQGCNSYIPTFRQYNWPVNTAVAICKAESGGNTSALSMTGDRGLMQINWIHADMVGGNLTALFDPSTNISVAYRIYSGRGWSAWSTYLSGAYLRYL